MNYANSTLLATTDTGGAFLTACEVVNGLPLDWSGRGSSHVDYDRSDVLPLTQGRFLGHGMHGGVYETTCNGHPLAWKRKFCRRKIGVQDRREIEIIKRLEHQHVIRLIGTYTHGPFLGLLLWPVATCDLASLLEDVDWLQKAYGEPLSPSRELDDPTEDLTEQISERETRLAALGLRKDSGTATRTAVIEFLGGSIGCIASAVAYLHASGIKHKDLKPSNILLSADGLWITDFGTATDFSILTSSATENGERGTPKYFAPEMASYAPTGRAADIFSMGCIFLEMITLCIGYTLDLTLSLREKNDRSFQSNLETIKQWFKFGRIYSRDPPDEHFLGLVRTMMRADPNERPTASTVEEDVALISGLARSLPSNTMTYSRPCCSLIPAQSGATAQNDRITEMTRPQMLVELRIGNTYAPLDGGIHSYTFYINLAREVSDLVAGIHVFIVSQFPNIQSKSVVQHTRC